MLVRKTLAGAVCLLMAITALGRGGGGCLEEGTLIGTPAGPVPIESLKPGNTVWTIRDSRVQVALVQSVTRVEPEEYIEIAASGRTLRATSEHPLEMAPGTFRVASGLQAGDSIEVLEGDRLRLIRIDGVSRVAAARPAFNLLVLPGGVFIANGLAVHNKGCFLPDTSILRADGTRAPVRDIRPGDALLAFTSTGQIVTTTVRRVLTAEVDDYLLVNAGGTQLRVTREHPFYVGGSTFKTLEALRVGDRIFVLDGGGLSQREITAIQAIHEPALVYNLQTDEPNTYFAEGVAVHNKGGGCFAAGTMIDTPRGKVGIEKLRPGDEVFGVDTSGARVKTSVEGVEVTMSKLLVLETDRGMLRTTDEHPLRVAAGGFAAAGSLKPGDAIICDDGSGGGKATLLRLTEIGGEQAVYNLQVGPPHTFVADGFVVHNKGGGFGGSYGGGHYGGLGGSGDPTWFLIVVGGIIVVVWSLNAHQNRDKNENLDYTFGRGAIEAKAAKTRKLLDFLSRVDQAMAVGSLEETARSTFLKLQQCWQARDYAPMKDLLMPDLFAEHSAQLAGLVRNHEINVIDDLRVEQVDIVNVRYTQKEDQREFTALISASARDYYVDARTGVFLRGDDSPSRFQEFWTFHRLGGAWLLREIDQTRESNVLNEENFFEQFTDTGLSQVYGDQAGKQGPIGPWLEKETDEKATRTERLLNFLVQTDKLWDRDAMLERARKVFLDVTLAREAGDPASIPSSEMFPGIASALQAELVRLGSQGTRIEFRNLCVRKVELLLVRNFQDNSQDEFTVRISAHAQRSVSRGSLLISRDPYVTPFVECWTLGRLDGEWKLKTIQPLASAEQSVRAENVDEDSSPQQLQWYYQQSRAI